MWVGYRRQDYDHTGKGGPLQVLLGIFMFTAGGYYAELCILVAYSETGFADAHHIVHCALSGFRISHPVRTGMIITRVSGHVQNPFTLLLNGYFRGLQYVCFAKLQV